MKALYTLSQNLQALRRLLLVNIQGNNSIVERITAGLPSNHPWLRWRAVPTWLTTATVEIDGEQVPEYRLRPGWGLEGFRGDQLKLPLTWIQTDAQGEITADATYAPGVFLEIIGRRSEFRLLVDAIKANATPDSWLGGRVTGREWTTVDGWVRFFRPGELHAYWAAQTPPVPRHRTNLGETYEEEEEEPDQA